MQSETFLSKLAKTIVVNHNKTVSSLVIILPNKRAKVFLIEELKNAIENTVFSPEIISIEEFVQDVAKIRSIDSIELIFEFYSVYLNLTDKSKQEPFETFANWAKTLLQDFNEIDRYLLEPNKVLKYLENIKELEHWSVEKKRTDLIEKHLAFWKLLPIYYEAYYKHLFDKGIGYQGLIYREAVNNLNHFSNSIGDKKIIFAGFNALNQAEVRIVQHLLSIEKATIYWDSEETFLKDTFHDAGLFLRRFRAEWSYYKSNPFEWIVNEYQQQKNIQIIGTPKSIGQAKIVGEIIQKQIELNNQSLQKVAVVLGEESLLIPVLYSLPASIDALNITMGYSSLNNPAQLLIAKLFKMHTNAIKRNKTNYVFYYKDVLDILNHPLIMPHVNAKELIYVINNNNFTFITHKKIFELSQSKNELFKLLFMKWETSSINVLESISEILIQIKTHLSHDSAEEKITNAFIYSIFKVINKLISYYSNYETIDNLDTLQAIYKQVVDIAEVSFEGEPLNGLQIMGVLESRVLDFDTVIITSVNEGKFPAGKSMNSFIPYDVKRELGLPTYKEKDAIYTYHFYHLLQRAKNIYLLYNTEADGIDGGEKSRFITQLLVEKQDNHNITEHIYNANVPDIAYKKISIPKSENVLKRLKEISETGFSPSSLTTYIRNPIQFYFQRILRISEVDEVEENIAVNTLGTIIHGALEELYKPLIDKFLLIDDLKSCISKIDEEVLKQFKLIYKEGEIKKGRNLLAFEVAKRNVLNFLKLEIVNLEKGEIVKILALEKECSRSVIHPNLPYPVLIKGKVDRIEIRNGIVRIIDYKTGKVEKNNVTLKNWNGLTNDIKNDKIIQILSYAFMYELEVENHEIEVGIISFKNLKSGFLPFTFKEDKIETTTINQDIMNNYIEELVVLLNEILDESVNFEEKVI